MNWRKLSFIEWIQLPDTQMVRCGSCKHEAPKSEFYEIQYCDDCNDNHDGCPSCLATMPEIEIKV